MIALWIMMLAGIVGGKVLLFGSRAPRFFYLMALGFLIAAGAGKATRVWVRESGTGLRNEKSPPQRALRSAPGFRTRRRRHIAHLR